MEWHSSINFMFFICKKPNCDALGSPRKMTDESGLVSWTGAYQPFGEMLAGSGNVHGFTGKELDSETGLNYFCLRYYDSQIGRFITLDSFGGYIELPQTQNRYAYCINNPLKYIDPLGLSGGEDGVWTKYKDIWFYIYGSGEMPGVTVIPYNWFSHLSLMQQMEILGYGDTEPIGRLMPEIPFPKGYIGPGQYPWWPETSPGSPPPSGGTAAPDVTYTFPEYKFQPYTQPIVPSDITLTNYSNSELKLTLSILTFPLARVEIRRNVYSDVYYTFLVVFIPESAGYPAEYQIFQVWPPGSPSVIKIKSWEGGK
ncbi:MAG: RHS repeat-associated core domain-containing protein [candidate division WOR-3 bacterium]